MPNFAKVTGHKNLIRDLNNGAVLETSKTALIRHRKNRKTILDNIKLNERVISLENDIALIKNKLLGK